MITVVVLRILGFIAANLPEALIAWLCRRAGDFIMLLPHARRGIVLANLHHAFPEKPPLWHRKIARESFRRLIEMSLFVVASPWFSRERIARTIKIPEATAEIIESMRKGNRGGVALMPHFTLYESLAALPALYPDLPPLGAIFRPFGNPHLNRWIKTTRERFGYTLFSRKEGFREALATIRNGGWVTILFDQNALYRGALIPFLGRVASATDLPGIMAQKYSVPAAVAYADRTGFWRAELRIVPLRCATEKAAVTVASNAWLEDRLRSSDDACADWLWAHRRWKTQVGPGVRLRLEHKKNLIPEALAYRDLNALPKNTRIWLRLPSNPREAVLTIPLVQAIRRGRPDAEVTVLIGKAIAPLFQRGSLADQLIVLPDPNKVGTYSFFRRLSGSYPDTIIVLTETRRADLEAFLTGSPQRFGLLHRRRWRPLLTHAWKPPETAIPDQVHQMRIWEWFLREFGLEEELELTPPLVTDQPTRDPSKPPNAASIIGTYRGTGQYGAEQWSSDCWTTLSKALLQSHRVENLAGLVDIGALIESIVRCDLVIADDPVGIQLANACGVPVAGLFGKANPLRYGPVFEAPFTILQPPGAPAHGGLPIAGIRPETVVEAIAELKESL